MVMIVRMIIIKMMMMAMVNLGRFCKQGAPRKTISNIHVILGSKLMVSCLKFGSNVIIIFL